MDAANSNYNYLFKGFYPQNYFSSCSCWRCRCWKNTFIKQVYFSLFIFLRYVKGTLPKNKPSTIGVEFATKNVDLKNGAGIVKT